MPTDRVRATAAKQGQQAGQSQQPGQAEQAEQAGAAGPATEGNQGGERGGQPARAGLVLLVVCVAQFTLLVDDTIVNVALPTIGEDLDLTGSGLSWVTNAYFLTFGGFLLAGGRLADAVGARRLFAIALAAFVAASLACGLAPNGPFLIGARGVQGVAGALLSPAALAILLATFREPAARGRALGAWAALTGLGAATGVLLGGALVEWADWRWIFLINLPVGAAALAVLPRVVPPGDRAAGRMPDLGGALLGTAALLVFVYTIVETHTHGWTSGRSLAGFAVTAVLAAVFAVHQRRAADPALPREILRDRGMMLADALMFVAAAGLFAMFFFLTLYMQTVQGWSPMRTGLSYLPFSAGMGVASAVGARLLTTRHGLLPLVAGPLIGAVGLFLMSRLDEGSSYAGGLLPALVVTALGIGLTFVPLMHAATNGAGEDGGSASALVTTCQQVGAAVGIAVLVTLATDRSADRARDGADAVTARLDGFTLAFEVQAGVLAASALLGLAIIAHRRRAASATAVTTST